MNILSELMSFYRKMLRFSSEKKILNRIKQATTYVETEHNGDVVSQDILINKESVKTSLTAKQTYLAAAAQQETRRLNTMTVKAERAGNPLPAQKIMQIRRAMERKRFEANRHIKYLCGGREKE